MKGREKIIFLHIPRRRSIPTLSHPSLHLKRKAIQGTRALILKG